MQKHPDISKARKSAVLILLYPGEEDAVTTLLIQRPTYNGVHSGQIAFPGGKFEPEDKDLIHTALRESYEEVGFIPEHINILGTLSQLYIPPSQLTLLPVMGYQDFKPQTVLDPLEVSRIIEVSLQEIISPSTFQQQKVNVGNWSEIVPCFNVRGNIIWGATAMILNELKTILTTTPSL